MLHFDVVVVVYVCVCVCGRDYLVQKGIIKLFDKVTQKF